MCVCVCTHMCVYVRAGECVCVCTCRSMRVHAYVHTGESVCVHMCMQVNLCVCARVYIHTGECVCAYVHAGECMYVHMYMQVNVCVCAYVHTGECVCVHTRAYVHAGEYVCMMKVDLGHQFSGTCPLTFLDNLLLNLELADLVDYLTNRLHGSPCFCFYNAEIIDICHHIWLLGGYWGSEHRSLCLRGKDYTDFLYFHPPDISFKL